MSRNEINQCAVRRPLREIIINLIPKCNSCAFIKFCELKSWTTFDRLTVRISRKNCDCAMRNLISASKALISFFFPFALPLLKCSHRTFFGSKKWALEMFMKINCDRDFNNTLQHKLQSAFVTLSLYLSNCLSLLSTLFRSLNAFCQFPFIKSNSILAKATQRARVWFSAWLWCLARGLGVGIGGWWLGAGVLYVEGL